MTILPRQAQDKNIGETRVFRRRRYFQNIRVATSADKGCMRVNITDHFHNSTFAVPLQAAGCESACIPLIRNSLGAKLPTRADSRHQHY
jgi:hypothetical protein